MARKKTQLARDHFSPLPPSPKGLSKRSASEVEIVRWVSKNIANPKPSAASCPDPFAWTLLKECRETEGFVAFFIEKLWAKLIPSRSQLDTQQTSELDGQRTVDMIGKILAIRRKQDSSHEEEQHGRAQQPGDDHSAPEGPAEQAG